MKNLLLLFLLSLTLTSSAICTLIDDGGDWSEATSWDCGYVPANSGDTMRIPASMTVVVDINSPTYSFMRIEVYGTMQFSNGQKINMDEFGVVDIYAGGILTGGNAGSRLNIGTNTWWSGSDPPLTGPTTVSNGGFLPIKLISFGVGTDDLNQVIIEWSTASQINNDYFTIQKSLNTLEWEDIKKIPGAGNSNTQIDYRSIDTDPYIGTSYYRLKQTDYDGVFETFNPKSVLIKYDMTIGLNIKPNPAISQIGLDLVHPNPNYHPYNHDVRIYNTNGEQVYKMYFMGNLNDFIIDVSKFKSGYYLVKSKSDEVKGVGKFMKK